ncbi:MAG: hypothetical protein ABIT38_14880 [Gemmatimonadaceae bacterium]
MTSRREFIERTSSSAALAALSIPLGAFTSAAWASESHAADEHWNLTWPSKITGRHKAVFDVAEVESGYGVWRASAWAGQYAQVLKVAPAQLSPVIVLRHNAIVLAMQQAFWDQYELGKLKSVTHPLTTQATDKNPVLLDETSGIPAPFNQAALHKQLKRGVIVLACNLALQDCVELIKKGGKSDEEAYKEAVANLVPGVILQPSGVFAAVRAQEAGCAYVRSS